MEWDEKKVIEDGKMFREVWDREGVDGIIRVIQGPVDELAPKIAERFPEIAAKNPKDIGQAAKAGVVAYVISAIKFAENCT